MELYWDIIFELKTELSKIEAVSNNTIDQVEYAIGHCKIALEKLRKLVLVKGFPDRKSEILFFKEIKPAAYGRLLYYQLVFEIESKRRNADVMLTKRYLQNCLYKINEFMEKRHLKVQYYRCGYKHLDEQYFLRSNAEIPLELKDSRELLDEAFFTWHDHTFSVIMANEMLMDYLSKEIEKLENPGNNKVNGANSSYLWCGKKIDLAELIYALHYAKMVNGGKTTIRELAGMFGQLFGVELSKDIYRFHAEIQQRKIDRTKFLDFLRSVLQQRLDEDNE